MAISFPATMPAAGAKQQIFELDRVDYVAPEARGRIGGISAGWPLWKSTVSFGTLTRTQSDQWRAFFLGQRGQQRIWNGFEIARRLPAAYLNGLPAGFSGACSSWSQALDANGYAVLTLSGLPVGFVLSATDYVDFRWGTYQRVMVRLLEGGVADASGKVSVSIEPPVHSVAPSNAVAHVDNPSCLMKFIMSESSLGAVGRRGAIESGTLVSVQDIIP